MPDDNLLKEAAEAMRNGEVWLALNAGGNFVRADYGALSKSLMLMYIETGSTEESFQKLKDAGDNAEIADMTYEEYLEQSKQQLSEEYLSYFDDNMRLKELPNERAAVVLMSDHYDGFYSEEFIANCLRRAFEMISEDENCKKELEKAESILKQAESDNVQAQDAMNAIVNEIMQISIKKTEILKNKQRSNYDEQRQYEERFFQLMHRKHSAVYAAHSESFPAVYRKQ